VKVGDSVDDHDSAGNPLYKYILPDGRVYCEAEQVILFGEEDDNFMEVYLALKNDRGNWIPISFWRKKEILPFEDWG